MLFRSEITKTVGKGLLEKIVSRCIEVHGTNVTAEVLDRIKAQGFKYSTRSGITVAVIDAVIPPQKAELLKEASMPEIVALYKEILSDFGKILTNTDKLEEYAVKFNAIAKANNITVKPIASLNDLADSVDDMNIESDSDVIQDSELMKAYYDFYAPFTAVINNVTSLDKASQTEFKTICQDFTLNMTNNMTNPSKLKEYAIKFNAFEIGRAHV